jgi:hypothetical protein
MKRETREDDERTNRTPDGGKRKRVTALTVGAAARRIGCPAA